MINTENQSNDLSSVNDGILRIVKQIITFQVNHTKIFEEATVNVATSTFALKKKVKDVDILDCIALYCKCDPMKEGTVESNLLVRVLEHKIHDSKNFKQGDTFTLKKK